MDPRFAGFIVSCFAADAGTCAGSVRATAFQAGGPSGTARRDVELTVDGARVDGADVAAAASVTAAAAVAPAPGAAPDDASPGGVFYDTPVAQVNACDTARWARQVPVSHARHGAHECSLSCGSRGCSR